MDLELVKEQICDVCHKTWQLGWVAANDGNVSARLEDGTILCTPTGMSKCHRCHGGDRSLRHILLKKGVVL